ncbi:hypothetical protein G7Y89_g10860 [Cudoniella acicularis]|uniref:Uncharacterized protein n=1 Tax=Cudoniella acicularis TaxID=354080 RepID=A0A8H4RDG9_9HELO|nr:hypothetical protein G7Y89_g10860 [Cudoniella acicularis]
MSQDKQYTNLFDKCTLSYLSGPLPEVRFQLSDKSIYGFPPLKPSSEWPSYFEIPNSSPAIRSYILGPNWESRLVKIPPINRWNYTQECIPTPSDPIDEAKHCLLMKRCGAQLHETTPAGVEAARGSNLYHKLRRKQIMGWPAAGGVWIYRLPEELFEDKSLEEGMEYLDRVASGEEPDYEHELNVLKLRLSQQLDMEGYCKVLQEAGAVFYPDPAECPEVKILDLWGKNLIKSVVKQFYQTTVPNRLFRTIVNKYYYTTLKIQFDSKDAWSPFNSGSLGKSPFAVSFAGTTKPSRIEGRESGT